MANFWTGLVIILALAGGVLMPLAGAQVLLEPEKFIEENFEEEPEQKVLWLKKDIKAEIADLLGHPYKGLRIRYWMHEDRTAWVLEEIGKVQPITAGFVVEEDAIVKMQVLVYREVHGWEVRYPFFTDQFKGLGMKKGRLSKKIDGISGATLSSNALIRLSKLALYLDDKVSQ
jgi:hypothetical protein